MFLPLNWLFKQVIRELLPNLLFKQKSKVVMFQVVLAVLPVTLILHQVVIIFFLVVVDFFFMN